MRQEITLSAILIILLVAILNPFHFWMPGMLVYTLLVALLLVFGVFAVFIWREYSSDERENLHKLMAGRFAFLFGAGILVLALVAQEVRGRTDIWLIIALSGMVLAKVGGLYYGKLRH